MNRKVKNNPAGRPATRKPLKALTFEELKQQASSFQEVSEWFKHHLPVLGITPPANLKNVTVSILGKPDSVLGTKNLEAPLLKATVEVSIFHDVEPAEQFKTDLVFTGYVESKTATKLNIHFPLNDWPFITARLAVDYLNDEVPCKPENVSAINPLLTKLMPLHFPGYTWENLQALCESNVLPTDSQDFLDSDAVLKILFASRNNCEHVSLPDTLSL